jgi:anaerobic ribonucleoside-triphosphate reductase
MLMDTQRIKEQEQDRTDREKVGEGLGFERTRRITGYLVGTLDRFNNAKRAEERDRVRHGV